VSLKKTGVQLVADGADAFTRAMADGDKAVLSFGKSATQVSGQVSGFGQVVTGALRQVGAIAVNALADAGRAVVGFVGDSVKKAGDFQAGMNEFAAVTGGALKESGKSLKDFSDLFIQLGRDLPVSTKDVEDAAIELAKGGIDPATIAAGALRTSLNLAAAGGLGLADSATIMAKQLGVWVDASASAADKSAFLTQTADLLSQAANVTTSNVSDMALGLANVGGVAKLTGLNFRETVQTMALLAPSFSSAGDAGTSFKSFLQRLQPQTKPAIAAMKSLGLFTDAAGSAFFDAQGQFVGMEKASALLQAATQGLTEAQKAQAFQTIFGTDAIRTAALLAEQGAAGYDAMGKQLDQAGSVADQAAQRQQGYNTALENAKGSFEALQLTIGSYIIPILTDLLNNWIAPGINQVTAFADAFFSASDKVDFLTTAIEGVLPGFGTLVDWLQVQIPVAITTLSTLWTGTLQPALMTAGTFITGTLVPGLISLNTWITTNVASWGEIALAIAAGVAAFVTISTVVSGVTAALTAIGTAFAVLTGPIGLVAVAVGALGLAWQTNFLGIRDSLTSWWNGSGKAIFAEVQTWLGTNIPAAVQTLASFWTGTLQPALASVWSFIQANVIPVLKVLATDALQSVVIAATAVASFWTSTLQPALSTVWSFIQSSVIPVLKTLATDAIQGVITVATTLASFWTGTLQPALSTVWAFINGSVIPVLKTLATDALLGVQIQAQALSTLWTTVLQPALSAVWSFVDTNIVPLFVALADVYIAALKLATTALAGIWQKELQPALSAVWSFIDMNVVPVFNTLGTVAMVAVKVASKEIADFWNNTLHPALTVLGSTLTSTVNPAVDNLGGLMGTLKSALGGVGSAIQSVTGFLGGLANQLNHLKLPDWMTPGSPTPWEIGLWGISKAMQQVAGSDLPLLNSNLQKVNQTFGALGQGQAMTSAAGGAVSSAATAIRDLLKTGDFQGGIFGLNEDDPFISFLLEARKDATATANILQVLETGNFRGGILGLQEDDPFIGFLLRAATSTAGFAQSTAKLTTDATASWLKLSAATAQHFGMVKQQIAGRLGEAQGAATIQTGIIRTTTDKDFQLVSDDTRRHFDQVHADITEQITASQTKLGQTTGAMQTGTAKTFGAIATTAKTDWQTTQTNITTPVSAAAASVQLDSAQMQVGMAISLPMQSMIEQTYQNVTDAMVHQIKKVTEAINDLYNRWVALLNLPKPHGPGDTGGPGPGPGPGGKQPLPGKALGGLIPAGQVTLVGERRPEVVVPQVPSLVYPSIAAYQQRISPPATGQQLMSSGGMGATVTNNYSFTTTGQYRYESPQTLSQKVRTLATFYGSTA